MDLYLGDCLDVLDALKGTAVDAVIVDPPYGTTKNKWDTPLDWAALWKVLYRLGSSGCPYVFFGSQPFTSVLVCSNLTGFKYSWVWHKSRFANQMLAKKQPLKVHEDIVVFGGRGAVRYYPQGLVEINKLTSQGSRITDNLGGGTRSTSYVQTYTNYPRSVQRFKSAGRTQHPTQKPVALMEYLVKTYTNEGETVLDFCMGSGSTGVACVNTGRNFIGIEKDPEYYAIAEKRIAEALNPTAS